MDAHNAKAWNEKHLLLILEFYNAFIELKGPHVHLVSYEALQRDTSTMLARIGAFLGSAAIGSAVYTTAAEHCSFDFMKAHGTTNQPTTTMPQASKKEPTPRNPLARLFAYVSTPAPLPAQTGNSSSSAPAKKMTFEEYYKPSDVRIVNSMIRQYAHPHLMHFWAQHGLNFTNDLPWDPNAIAQWG